MIPHATGLQLAKHVERLLAPACVEIMVVGSLRRQKDQVKDIEFVVRSKPAAPVFGEPLSSKPALETLLARLLRHGDLRLPEPSRRVDGAKQKRFVLPQSGGVELELWIADPSGANFGNMVAIRTGDYEFSQLLVTQRSRGGLLPDGWMQAAGYLFPYRLPKAERERLTLASAPQPPLRCATEEAFFERLGIRSSQIPNPSARNQAMAERLRGRLAAGKVTA